MKKRFVPVERMRWQNILLALPRSPVSMFQLAWSTFSSLARRATEDEGLLRFFMEHKLYNLSTKTVHALLPQPRIHFFLDLYQPFNVRQDYYFPSLV